MKILSPSAENIQFAAEALKRGELIGLPTETVYGIAAVATNRDAVRKTFQVKGRPSDNPLIVHLASRHQAATLVSDFPEEALWLAEEFWPGPLTLVLPKSPVVPDEVTAGLETVALRVPSHPVARMILEAAEAPLSAPSANRFMSLSPTRADMIAPKILQGLACVIDGGPCQIGVESTVVDCSGSGFRILRPGGISQAQIEAVVGALAESGAEAVKRSPGMYSRHYSPLTPIRLVGKLSPEAAGIGFAAPQNQFQRQLPDDPAGFASQLYATLFELDRLGVEEIQVEMPPGVPEWAAVLDRLRKMVG